MRNREGIFSVVVDEKSWKAEQLLEQRYGNYLKEVVKQIIDSRNQILAIFQQKVKDTYYHSTEGVDLADTILYASNEFGKKHVSFRKDGDRVLVQVGVAGLDIWRDKWIEQLRPYRKGAYEAYKDFPLYSRI